MGNDYADEPSGQFMLNDRKEAGLLLAAKLKGAGIGNALVLAIPRGGVVLGQEIAGELGAELDIVTPRKLKHPENPELAIGAVMPDGSVYLNEQVLAISPVASSYMDEEKRREVRESQRRLEAYRGRRPYPQVKGRTVILVDDGIATGATMVAAARWVRAQGASDVVVAIPVIPRDTLYLLREIVSSVVYLAVPEVFYAIGQFYRRFEQVEDNEVMEMLDEYWKRSSHAK